MIDSEPIWLFAFDVVPTTAPVLRFTTLIASVTPDALALAAARPTAVAGDPVVGQPAAAVTATAARRLWPAGAAGATPKPVSNSNPAVSSATVRIVLPRSARRPNRPCNRQPAPVSSVPGCRGAEAMPRVA